jgi:cytoskeletal protein CcmA (bactofilin family)
MLGKKENGVPAGSSQTLNTIIGRGTVFDGTMTVDNSVRIDGVFKGELSCSGALTISQAGEAYAQLEGKDIYINGIVRGTVRAQKVRLDSQARFVGDIHTGALSVAEGAVFHGSCAMQTANDTRESGQADGAKRNAAEKAAKLDGARKQSADASKVATN